MSKRKIDDDFVYTLSDNEDDAAIAEEEKAAGLEAGPPKKKSKKATAAAAKKQKQKSKKNNKKNGGGGGQEEDEDEDEHPSATAEDKVDDDGAMDSDFEFMMDGTADFRDEDFAGWGMDGAKKGGAKGEQKKAVDLNEIIRKRRVKKGEVLEEPEANGAEDASKADNDEDEDDGEVDIDFDDDDDEVLAADGFGMGADSAEESGDDVPGDDDESSEDGDDGEDYDNDDEDEDDDAASDNDSVATPTGHPDDGDDSDESDAEDDAEEAAKREAFFAPEDKADDTKKGSSSSFRDLYLSRPILRGLNAVGWNGKPTPIQSKSIPIALEGKDLVGGAVTGSGKTGAFVLPILERLLYRPKKVPTSRVVILTPTRELAIQAHAVATKLASYTDIKFCLAVGGLSLKVQEAELRLRPDVIIATPGRFIDHMRNSASFSTDSVEILVLDEADRMLEDGFADELNEILTTLPKSRQTMLFSATMTSSVDRLIRVGMNKPVRVMVDSQKKTVDKLEQKFVRLRPGREDKRMGYLVHICKTMHSERVIIFFRQKKEAHRARIIFGLLGMSCAELHGSMNQAQRISSVEEFRDGKVSFLLATDLASRGLDIKGIDTVINYEAPQSVEIYIHRIGRTARAGRSGVAVTLAAEPDRKVVKAAVKAAKAQNAKISSVIIDPSDADQWQSKVDEMEDEIESIMVEEKEEKQLANVEMQIKKGENMMQHEEEIKGRPKRTWFETQHDKQKAKDAGRAELNGLKETMKKKNQGKLSNKDRKKLDAKTDRAAGRAWKKGSAERAGKGAVLNFKKDKSAKSGGKGKGKSTQHTHLRPREATEFPLAALSADGPSELKLAPPRRFILPPRAGPHNRSSLLQYIFPKTVRDRYRDRLFKFHLDTLPGVKHRLQSRIYRLILEHQRRRRDQSRLIDRARRLLTGRHLRTPAAGGRGSRSLLAPAKYGLRLPAAAESSASASSSSPTSRTSKKMTSMPGYGVGSGNYGETEGAREPGARRRKLAAMAGSVYRAGASAANEIRESYNQTRSREIDHPETSKITIPGSFPDVAIITKGDEQMVLFPSYAKRHVRNEERQFEVPGGPPDAAAVSMNEQEYWRQEWSRHEDEKAVVDVDVRGWIYNPHRGPITRRNRMLIGLARQLSGIPAPSVQQSNAAAGGGTSWHQQHEEQRDQERIAMRAKEIERQGKEEQEAAQKGGYSERPSKPSAEEGDDASSREHLRISAASSPVTSRPGSPSRSSMRRTNTSSTASGASELTDAELAVANANLMARIAPFMTTPLVQIPITLFFYNDSQSQSRTIMTNDSGHFMTRAALEFVPTHVRVMANENISCVEPVQIIEPKGVSLISDIDDTIKRSNISLGAKEIFRNTFVRELHGSAIEGVKEWYNSMYELGVKVHYCSNSPWQLYPVLATFFKLAGLPPGSLHLKAYSGMLQGIFEPVAERKKGTLERIMKDFPERKFILIGDSGEADLEVYTELAMANPKRILAIFIRDVTTPEQPGYFDSSFAAGSRALSHKSSADRLNTDTASDDPSSRPALPPRTSQLNKPKAAEEEDLIDFSEMSQTPKSDTTGKKAPPRPVKPKALQGSPSFRDDSSSPGVTKTASQSPQPPPSRRSTAQSNLSIQESRFPTQRQNSFDRSTPWPSPRGSNANGPPAPPPPRRQGTPLSNGSGSSSYPGDMRRGSSSTVSSSNGMLHPDSKVGAPTHQLAYAQQMPQPADRKVELWQARLQRAHDTLDNLGISLYTWRRGGDVIQEAVGIIKRSLRELGVDPAKSRRG